MHTSFAAVSCGYVFALISVFVVGQQMDIELLEEIVKRDPLSEISEQEKELLWRLRYD